MRSLKLTTILLILFATGMVYSVRIKDIVTIQGERGNSLYGTGLVVGLNGTGDSSLPSAQMLSSILREQDQITLTPNMLTSANIALVRVTAELPAYAEEGDKIDITVSSIGDCKSLQGGELLATPLKSFDGEVYAVARSGSISTASWTVESGATGSKIAKNHPTAGRIPEGAYVEMSSVAEIVQNLGGVRFITLKLKNSDSTTAQRIGEAINKLYPGSAFVQNAGTIRVKIPDNVTALGVNSFLVSIIEPDVEVDMRAVVVINERTGTIVAGGNVTISETAIAQGSLVVKIKEQQLVSQPGGQFTPGATTAVVPDSSIYVEEEEGHLIRVPKVVTVSELVDGLNAIGATPRDLIAIFNALRVAGALHAEIKMM